MSKDDQHYPLAPETTYLRSHAELPMTTHNHKSSSKQKGSSKFVVYFLAGFVIVFATFLIIASIILDVKTPQVELTSVILKNLRYGNASLPYLNATIVSEVSINNNNYGRFNYGNSSAGLYYGIYVVGSAKIGQGHAKEREKKKINVTTYVSANGRLSNTTDLRSDIALGLLDLTSYAKINGEVHLMNVVKRERTAEMNCNMTLDLKSRTIRDLLCS